MNNYKTAFWILLIGILIISVFCFFNMGLVMFGWGNMGMMGNVNGHNYHNNYHHNMNMDEMRDHHISLKSDIMSEKMADGDYACCLEHPCTYCIEKTPGHGEGASCHCLEDVMNGAHPCGECMGEILEGHGNKYISKYFATAIAEEVGEDYLEDLQKIIEEKYGIPVDEQE